MNATTMPHEWQAAQVMATAHVRAARTATTWPGSRSRSALGRVLLGRSVVAAGRGACSWLRPIRLRCLIVGHDDYLAREPDRLFLRCGECGRGTRGWVLSSNAPRVTAGIVRRGSRGGAATARRSAIAGARPSRSAD